MDKSLNSGQMNTSLTPNFGTHTNFPGAGLQGTGNNVQTAAPISAPLPSGFVTMDASPGETLGFCQVAKAEEATSIGPSKKTGGLITLLNRKGDEPVIAPPQPAQGPPWIIGYFIYDADTHDLIDFIKPRIQKLGAAAGENILLMAIGDPAQSDDFYKENRSETLVKHDHVASAKYKKEIAALGSELFLKMREVDVLKTELKVDEEALPCLAFTTAPFWYPIVIMHIDPQWYRYPEVATAFSKLLTKWLDELDFEEMVSEGITNRDILNKFRFKLMEWKDVLASDLNDVLLHEQSLRKHGHYCRAITEEGEKLLSLHEFQHLEETDYNMFFNGFDRRFRHYDKDKVDKSGRLRPGESKMFIKIIGKNGLTRIEDVRVSSGQSPAAARQMFKRLKLALDTMNEQHQGLVFESMKLLSSERWQYKFAPPAHYKYCLIIPRQMR